MLLLMLVPALGAFARPGAEHSLLPPQQPAIEGHVFEDAKALADLRYFTPLRGVTVRLYRDDGDNRPSAGDTLLTTTQTGMSGEYAFHPQQGGTYWVTVDSRTIPSTPGAKHAWAEQTYGPPNGQCAGPQDVIRNLAVPGPCVGGKLVNRSDQATNAETAEHIARVTTADPPGPVDFAFSFNVVSSLADTDSDVTPIQGSLRQFLVNANERSGPNAMRFVPVSKPQQSERPMFDGDPPHWWTITLRRPLPALSDGETTIDGAAFSFMSPSSRRLPSRGWKASQQGTRAADIEPNADLEIATRGEEGIACEQRCVLRQIAIYGAAVSIVLRADALIEELVAGAHADTRPVGARGTAGIQVERGKTVIRRVYAGDQNSGGIIVATKDALLEAENIQVERCGQPEGGAAIVLLADRSIIRASLLRQNFGAGLVLGLPSSADSARGNVITASVISGNSIGIVLSPGAMDNQISGNEFMWNRFGGITVAPYTAAAVPLHNRISGNRFDENGGRPISLDPRVPSNAAMLEAITCKTNPALANGGVKPPRISSLTRSFDAAGHDQIVVRGEGCASTEVELYQSYVTASVRGKSSDVRKIRRSDSGNETPESSTDTYLPSIGEFNPVSSTVIRADGRFEFVVPVNRSTTARRSSRSAENGDAVRFRDVFGSDEIANSAFTALTIDAAGNTSELGVRHLIR